LFIIIGNPKTLVYFIIDSRRKALASCQCSLEDGPGNTPMPLRVYSPRG
jgi:hypothetical protein